MYASTYGRFNTPDPARSAKAKNPLSWNRYSYTHGDPINRNDPRGLTCVDQGGTWADDGDGPAASDAGTNALTNTGVTYYAGCTLVYGQCDVPIYGFNGMGGAIVNAVGQMLSSISVGGFVYGGLESPTSGAQFGTAGIYQCDSNSGCGTSTLSEITIGGGEAPSGGPLPSVTIATETSTNGNSSDNLVFFGVGDVGGLVSTQSGTFGIYVGTSEFGIGGYISFGGNTSTAPNGGPSVSGGGGSDSDSESNSPGVVEHDDAIRRGGTIGVGIRPTSPALGICQHSLPLTLLGLGRTRDRVATTCGRREVNARCY